MQNTLLKYLFVLYLAILSSKAFGEFNKSMQIKAIFLYNFANFVEWPDEAFKSDSAPLKICLYGDVPFGTLLDMVDGTLIGHRKLKIFRTAHTKDIQNGCQILFVGRDKHEKLPELWNNINYFYVLSIGEQNQFTDLGGIINILQTTHRVQFQINISNALDQGLFLSSDLLSLAREIKRNTTVAERQ